jgi:microcin C transport system ATP-binding protein
MLRLETSEGAIRFEGRDIQALDPRRAPAAARRGCRSSSRTPMGALSPRMTVAEIVGEGLAVHERLSAADRAARVAEALREVGLEPAMAERYPHESAAASASASPSPARWC